MLWRGDTAELGEAVGLRPGSQQSRIPVSGTKDPMGMWIQQLRELDADKEKKADGSSRTPDPKVLSLLPLRGLKNVCASCHTGEKKREERKYGRCSSLSKKTLPSKQHN